MRFEGGLVAHGPNLFDPIAEIQIVNLVALTKIDQIEDIQGAGAAVAVGGIKVKIDSIEKLIRYIDDGHAEQVVTDPVADLKAVRNRGNKKSAVISLGRAFPIRKAGGQKCIEQSKVFLAHN